MLHAAKAFLLACALLAVGCSNGNQQTIDTSGASTPTCAKSKSVALTDATQVTFYGDLYPVLDSSSQGAAYKCTTCHANFKKPDSMNNTTTVNSVISDMQTGKMPRPGDLVPADKIALFIVWQQQGFPEGTPGQAPSGYDVSALTSGINAAATASGNASQSSGGSSTNTPTPCASTP